VTSSSGAGAGPGAAAGRGFLVTGAGHSGLFYDTCAVRPASPVATQELAGQLWKHSAGWTGLG
jgi:hypothetical protein